MRITGSRMFVPCDLWQIHTAEIPIYLILSVIFSPHISFAILVVEIFILPDKQVSDYVLLTNFRVTWKWRDNDTFERWYLVSDGCIYFPTKKHCLLILFPSTQIDLDNFDQTGWELLALFRHVCLPVRQTSFKVCVMGDIDNCWGLIMSKLESDAWSRCIALLNLFDCDSVVDISRWIVLRITILHP